MSPWQLGLSWAVSTPAVGPSDSSLLSPVLLHTATANGFQMVTSGAQSQAVSDWLITSVEVSARPRGGGDPGTRPAPQKSGLVAHTWETEAGGSERRAIHGCIVGLMLAWYTGDPSLIKESPHLEFRGREHTEPWDWWWVGLEGRLQGRLQRPHSC